MLTHAVLRAEAGGSVVVIIDDRGARRLARIQIERLKRRRIMHPDTGDVQLESTLSVLSKAATRGIITDSKQMRTIYQAIEPLDDGLVPLEQTDLLKPFKKHP